MSEKKFRFVSPGIFLNEIDNSLLPRQPEDVGPVVIGRTQRGPAMRPVKVNSFLEFTELFGSPVPGGEGGDVWRNGNRTTPMYATYAARAWLRNGSPLTVVRTLGSQADQGALPAGEAGWQVGTDSYGLFVCASGSGSMTGTMAAIFYLDASSSFQLSGNQVSGGATTAAATLIESQGANYEFKAVVSDGVTPTNIVFNLNPGSSKYIRKVFNTNPTLLGAETPTGEAKTYFLGESFERNVSDVLTAANADAALSGGAYAYIAKLTNGGDRKGSDFAATNASTGMVVAQHTGEAGDFTTTGLKDLFRLEAIDSGEHANANIKISISDIKASSNEDVNPYGSFTVEVRAANDTDARKKVLETFTNCNLNHESPDYIAAKIGDKYADWSDADSRFIEYGDYDNKSSYIRVADIATINNKSLLPFGFRGPQTYIGHEVDTSGTISGDNNLINEGSISAGAVPLSISGPKHALRVSSSDGGLTDPTAAYFGADMSKESGKGFEKSNIDLNRLLPEIAANQKADSFVFTLDNLKRITIEGEESPHVAHVEGSRQAGTSLNSTGTDDYQNVLDAGFNKFTMPMVGGFDGFDVTEADPLRNGLMTGDERSSSPVNTLKRAINMVSDPELIEMNLACVPGITAPAITNHLVDTCERRADALAIIDLEGGYEPAHESSSGADVGSAKSVVTEAKTRAMNTSYACAYHPWIQSKDEFGSGKMLWLPPSIAALGTFASTDRNSAPWFAPAGFTRGGLTDGSAGIPVSGVREHLTRKMRDSLYENNINPIAKFPAEGIVIFGQKTLQASDSALDRVNVRRLMLHVKKGISRIASTLLFDQNLDVTWERFSSQANGFLADVQSRLGLTEFRVVLDETTTTADLVDRNTMYAKVFLKPARSIEFIAVDFVIQKTGASFDD